MGGRPSLNRMPPDKTVPPPLPPRAQCPFGHALARETPVSQAPPEKLACAKKRGTPLDPGGEGEHQNPNPNPLTDFPSRSVRLV
jgi:hypothetical protein